jgi:hypothetical protein
VLFANSRRLRDQGVLVPGSQAFDHNRAANAVASARPKVVRRGSRYALWNRFLREIAAWDGTVIISNEWFVKASTEQARLAVEELEPAEVHVVFTARDLVRQAPAAWQEELKLGKSSSLDDFLKGLDQPDTKWSWSTLDPAVVLPRWAAHLPPSQIHVVTVPKPGSPPGLLWRRFSSVCGIDPDSCNLEVAQANESLSAESARLLQEVGPLLREAIDSDHQPWPEQYRWIRRFVGHELLVPMRGSKIGLDPDARERLRTRGLQSAQAIREEGWDVVGDLDDLTNTPTSEDERHPDDVTRAELLDLSLRLNAALLAEVRNRTAHTEDAS